MSRDMTSRDGLCEKCKRRYVQPGSLFCRDCAKALGLDKDHHRFENEIEQWIRWFRGINNPEVQRKVAVRQLNMLRAEKCVVYRETIYGSRRGSYMVLHAANDYELKRLDQAMREMMPKVPTELPEPEPDPEDDEMAAYLKRYGYERIRNRERGDEDDE